MAFNPQFKVNQMAKDMGLKSKELTDLLADKGIGDVKSQKTLSEHLHSQAVSADKYFRYAGEI